VFLLVKIKIAIQRFLALLPCTSVLQTELIHLYLTSSLLPGHLPILPLPTPVGGGVFDDSYFNRGEVESVWF
jgi:hypothetical protein